MLSNKSIKKFVLLSLFITLSAEAITMPSWLSLSSVKSRLSQFYPDMGKVSKKYAALGAIAFGGSIATVLGIRYFRKRQKSRAAEERLKTEAAKKRKAKEQVKLEQKKKESEVAVQKAEQERLGRIRSEREEQQKKEAERVKLEREEEQRIEEERVLAAEKAGQEGAISEEQKAETAEIGRQDPAIADFDESKENVELEVEKVAGGEPGQLILVDDFVEVNREDAKVNCSQLTWGYLEALFNEEISFQEYISQANDYSAEEREKLAKISNQSIDAEDENKVRAFEYIENGYKNLANILNDNFDYVSGYDQVARMTDKEAISFQTEGRAGEKEKIRQSYLSSIISVVWCLYDRALRTGDAFTQGAFGSNSTNLYNFFLRYIIFVNRGHKKMGLFGGNCNHPHAYQRVSSHLKDLAEERNFHQYGIDVRFGGREEARNFLPNKMTHILFVPYDPENHKFILKPEDDCMFNIDEIFLHGFGLVRSKWEAWVGSSDSEKHQRKERIPKTIMSHFDELMKQSSIGEEERVQYNAAVKAQGIQAMVALAVAGKFKEDTPIGQYIKGLEKKNKHANMRFWCEVISTEEELGKDVACE